jgi:hypothetical protein
VDRVLEHFCLLFGAGVLGLLPGIDHRRIPASYFRLVVLVAWPALVIATVLAFHRGHRPEALAALALALLPIPYLVLLLTRRPDAARVLGWILAGVAVVALYLASRSTPFVASEPAAAGAFFPAFLSAVAGAGLLGSVLLAMLLGHAYLNVPGLPIIHLRRLAWMVAGFLAIRLLVVGIAARSLLGRNADRTATGGGEPWDAALILASDLPLLAMRCALGVLVPAVLAVMIDRTARIRSTQSATGLLYVALVFVLFGELIASYLWVAAGLPA